MESAKQCARTAILLWPSEYLAIHKVEQPEIYPTLAWEITDSWEIHALNPREWLETRLFSLHCNWLLFLTKMTIQVMM